MNTKIVLSVAPSVFLLCGLLLVGGCSTPESSESLPGDATSSSTFSVSCTSNIVKDLVAQVGGDHISVTAIMDGPGVDPHLYTPSPQDINVLTQSDVVVYSGLHLEAQLEEALESLETRSIPVIKVTEILERDHADALLEADGAVDPHVWFDLVLWGKCAGWLADELAKIDPDNADSYRANAEAFQVQLAETQSKAEQLLKDVDEERRILVTAHDAFQYFARTFKFRVEAVQGLSTESEPGLKRINELATLLVDSKIHSIFTEQSVSDRNIQALLAECKSRGHQITIGGTLYSDTAGPAGTPEETLAGAVMHDVRNVARGLRVATGSQETP